MDDLTTVDKVRFAAAAVVLTSGIAAFAANKVNGRRARKQKQLRQNDTIRVTSVNANSLTA